MTNEKRLRIEINNLKQEKSDLEGKLKKLENNHKTIVTSLVETFQILLENKEKEIKLLKEEKAKIEAETILKELKKIIRLNNESGKVGK